MASDLNFSANSYCCSGKSPDFFPSIISGLVQICAELTICMLVKLFTVYPTLVYLAGSIFLYRVPAVQEIPCCESLFRGECFVLFRGDKRFSSSQRVPFNQEDKRDHVLVEHQLENRRATIRTRYVFDAKASRRRALQSRFNWIGREHPPSVNSHGVSLSPACSQSKRARQRWWHGEAWIGRTMAP